MPRKRRKTHHLPFSASFSLGFQRHLSLSLTALSLMKEAFESFSGGYISIYLVPLCLKKGLKSELAAIVCQGVSNPQHLSDFVFSEMESAAGAGLYFPPLFFFFCRQHRQASEQKLSKTKTKKLFVSCALVVV